MGIGGHRRNSRQSGQPDRYEGRAAASMPCWVHATRLWAPQKICPRLTGGENQFCCWGFGVGFGAGAGVGAGAGAGAGGGGGGGDQREQGTPSTRVSA